MGRYYEFDYDDFVEAMKYEKYYRYDHLPDYNSDHDCYYDNDEEEEEEEEQDVLGPKIFWIKLIQRHWKKTFNSNKKYKGMLSIYKLKKL